MTNEKKLKAAVTEWLEWCSDIEHVYTWQSLPEKLNELLKKHGAKLDDGKGIGRE